MIKLIIKKEPIFELLIICLILAFLVYNNSAKMFGRENHPPVTKIAGKQRLGNDFSQHVINNPVSPATIKIVFLGSSVVWGQYLDSINDSIPYQVEKMLQSKVNKRIKVYNLAIKGDTFFEDYYIFQKVMTVTKPDLIVWGFYPGRDFKFQYPTPLGKGYWLKRPADALQAFSYLDYLFWQDAKALKSSQPSIPFIDYLIKREVLEEKTNFLFKVLLNDFFNKMKINRLDQEKKKFETVFTSGLSERGVKIPKTKKSGGMIKELGYAPNDLSDLAIKFLDECKEQNIQLLIYNHPITESFPDKNYLPNYSHNIEYMSKEFEARQIPFLRVENTWDKDKYYHDYSHFNAVGSKKMAALVANYIISNKLVK